MIRRKHTMVFAGMLILLLMKVNAQVLQDSTSRYFVNDPFESVHFTTERDFYLAGESCWFQAACIIHETNTPSTLSKILYIELFDTNGKSWAREKFRLEKGLSNGNFILPEDLPSGSYFLRAYTRYQCNFPEKIPATIPITVVNPLIPLPEKEPEDDKVTLTAEGTGLVKGLPGRIAIRFPVELLNKGNTACIIGSNGDTLAQVEPAANGLALVDFTPTENSACYLRYASDSTLIINEPLPAVRPEGYSLGVITGNDGLLCDVKGYGGLINSGKKLMIHLVHPETGKVINKLAESPSIKIEEYRDGINYLLLTDESLNILQYKCLFLLRRPSIHIPVRISSNEALTRQSVKLELVPPHEGFDDTAFLSISVVRAGTADWNNTGLPAAYVSNPDLISPSLLASFDSPGMIIPQAEAALIIAGNNDTTRLRNLISGKKYPLKYLPEVRDISISGVVMNKQTSESAAGIEVYASVLFRNKQVHSVRTGIDGRFTIAFPGLSGKQNLYLGAGNNDDYELYVDNDFNSNIPRFRTSFAYPDTSSLPLIEELWVNSQVRKNFRTSPETKAGEIRPLPMWFGDGMIYYRLDDYINLNSMKEVFNEIIPYVGLHESGGKNQLSVFDKGLEMTSSNPLLLLDYIPLPDPAYLLSLSPSQVESIGVITGYYISGDRTWAGVVSVQTKAGNFGGIELPGNSSFLEFQAVSPDSWPVFPEYNEENTVFSGLPDFRTVLYYNPHTEFSRKKISAEFYTSDREGTYDIIVRGYTRKGTCCYGHKTITVKSRE